MKTQIQPNNKTLTARFCAFLASFGIVPTYKVTYAPADSRNPHLPIQAYTIAGNPKHLAWKSQAGNRLFTALLPHSAKPNQFAAFRADRTLSINLAGFAFLGKDARKSYQSTVVTPAPALVTA